MLIELSVFRRPSGLRPEGPAGDVTAAEAAMRAHLARAEILLGQTISDHPDYFE